MRVWNYFCFWFHAELIMKTRLSQWLWKEILGIYTDTEKPFWILTLKGNHFLSQWVWQTNNGNLFRLKYWLQHVTNCPYDYSFNIDIEDIFDTLQMTCNSSTVSHCFSLHWFWHLAWVTDIITLKAWRLKLGVVSTKNFIPVKHFAVTGWRTECEDMIQLK